MTSRRYGRLKRRSADQIASLQVELASLRAALDSEKQAHDLTSELAHSAQCEALAMKGILNGVYRALPRGSHALPPMRKSASSDQGPGNPQQGWRVPVERKLEPLNMSATIADVRQYARDLVVVIGRIGFDHFAQRVHFEMDFGLGVLCYSATTDALQDQGPERLVRTVADSLADQFARDLPEVLKDGRQPHRSMERSWQRPQPGRW